MPFLFLLIYVFFPKEGMAFIGRRDMSTNVYNKKVLRIVFNPDVPNLNNTSRLYDYMGWKDPVALSESLISWFKSVSGRAVNYVVVEDVLLKEFPTFNDGRKYDSTSYIKCVKEGGANCFKNPDGSPMLADYQKILRDNKVCEKVNAGQINEVWMFGAPYFGFFESNLVGPNAYEFNSLPTANVGCNFLTPVMGFSVERTLAEMIHNYGHAFEAVMFKAYGKVNSFFGAKFNDIPACGLIHWPPNASKEYDTASRDVVGSTCDDYWNYPDETYRVANKIDCTAWGCDDLGYYTWLFSHIPRYQGIHDGLLNDWWMYLMKPETALDSPPAVPTVIPTPTRFLTPTPTPVPVSGSVLVGFGIRPSLSAEASKKATIMVELFDDVTGVKYGKSENLDSTSNHTVWVPSMVGVPINLKAVFTVKKNAGGEIPAGEAKFVLVPKVENVVLFVKSEFFYTIPKSVTDILEGQPLGLPNTVTRAVDFLVQDLPVELVSKGARVVVELFDNVTAEKYGYQEYLNNSGNHIILVPGLTLDVEKSLKAVYSIRGLGSDIPAGESIFSITAKGIDLPFYRLQHSYTLPEEALAKAFSNFKLAPELKCTPCLGSGGKNTGDANCDGRIGPEDFNEWEKEFFALPYFNKEGEARNKDSNKYKSDYNCDSRVTKMDFDIWLSNAKL